MGKHSIALSLTSSPVLRGRIEEGESRKGDLSQERDRHDLKLASAPAVACPLLYPPPYDGGGNKKVPKTKNAGDKAPAFPFVQVAASGLLIVVEATLARLVVTLAARPVGRTLVTTCRPGDFAATTTVETATAAGRRRTAGEVGASIAHRAAVAAARASAAITTAAAAAAVTAAATVAAATTAAAITTATAATVAATTTAAAVGRTRTTRAEAAAIATATAAESAAATTTGLAFNGFADGDRSTIEQRAVHGLHGRGALIICFHLEEGEAAAAAGLAIHDHF
jgi:hypothetical protein